jgi:hypothetical protein
MHESMYYVVWQKEESTPAISAGCSRFLTQFIVYFIIPAELRLYLFLILLRHVLLMYTT